MHGVEAKRKEDGGGRWMSLAWAPDQARSLAGYAWVKRSEYPCEVNIQQVCATQPYSTIRQLRTVLWRRYNLQRAESQVEREMLEIQNADPAIKHSHHGTTPHVCWALNLA